MHVLDGYTSAQDGYVDNFFGEPKFANTGVRLVAAQSLAVNDLDTPLPDPGHKVHNMMSALWGEEDASLRRIARSLYWWTDKVNDSSGHPILIMRSGTAEAILTAAEDGTPLAPDLIEDEGIRADFGYISDIGGNGQSTFVYKGSEEGDDPRQAVRHPNLWFSLGATVTGLQVIRYHGFTDRVRITNQDKNRSSNHLVSVLEGVVPVPEVKADDELGISLKQSFDEAKFLYGARKLRSANVYFGGIAIDIIEALAIVAKRGAPERFEKWNSSFPHDQLDLGTIFRDRVATAAKYIPELLLPRPPKVNLARTA